MSAGRGSAGPGVLARAALVVMAFGAATWLGGVSVRAIVGFSLLQFGTLEFRSNIHPTVERAVFSLLAQSSLVLAGAYAAVVLAAVVFLRAARPDLRREGWMMVSAILFFAFLPVEVYTMVLDVRMWLLDAAGSNDLVEFRKLFIHRLAALAGVPMIALLSYYTIVALIVFRPLRREAADRTAP